MNCQTKNDYEAWIIIAATMNKLRMVLLLGIILAIGLSLLFWWGTPRLREVSPSDGSSAVAAGASLRLSFSRRMRSDSLEEFVDIQPSIPGVFSWEGVNLVFTPEQPWPAGSKVSVELKPGLRSAGLLSLPLRDEKNWSFTVRQPRLAFLYPSVGAAQIYLLNPASGKSQALTDGSGEVLGFSLLSRGASLYYSLRTSQEGSAIYRLALDRGESGAGEGDSQEGAFEPELVHDCPEAVCRVPAVSPDGKYLAFERTPLPGGQELDAPMIWLLQLQDGDPDEDSGTNAEPYLAGDPNHQTLQPAWSSDGLLTFYDTNAAAFIFVHPQDGEVARFPNQTGQPGDWHPNGRFYIAPEIFFLDENFADTIEDVEPFANSHLLVFNWQDGAIQDLTVEETIEDSMPVFSPDGEYLALARKYLDEERWTPGRQIWLMRLGSREAWPITDDPLYNHFEFAWDPAGGQLAYVRFNQSSLTEPTEIWVMDLESGRSSELIRGGYSPVWIP